MSHPASTGNVIWIQDANGLFYFSLHHVLWCILSNFKGQPQMIKVVHATANKGVPVSVAPGTVRAVLRSNVSQCLVMCSSIQLTM